MLRKLMKMMQRMKDSEGGMYVDILWWNEVNYNKINTNALK